jgi:hypothetical protein
MSSFKCQCCEREYHQGSLKYVVEIKSFADFEGYIEGNDGEMESTVNDLLMYMDDVEQQVLEDDVYQEIRFTVCKECREKFIKNPFQVYREYFYREEFRGTLH